MDGEEVSKGALCARTVTNLHNHEPFFLRTHSFVVRIWWESGLTQPDGRPLWRGYVQHAISGQSLVFQSLDQLLCFIQTHTGELEKTPPATRLSGRKEATPGKLNR